MLKRLVVGTVLVLGLAAAPAHAAVLFLDSFNTENGGVGTLNYSAFQNFSISNGTVDLIGTERTYGSDVKIGVFGTKDPCAVSVLPTRGAPARGDRSRDCRAGGPPRSSARRTATRGRQR